MPQLFPPLTKVITSIQVEFLDTVMPWNINLLRFRNILKHLIFTHPSSLLSGNRQNIHNLCMHTQHADNTYT